MTQKLHSKVYIYPREMKTRPYIYRCVCIYIMVREALFAIAKKWKQRQCLSAYEWTAKLWYIQEQNANPPEKGPKC